MTTTLSLAADEHAKLVSTLGSRDDASLAARVLETVYAQYADAASPQYLIDTRPKGSFVVRIVSLASRTKCTDVHVGQLMRLDGKRVLGVEVHMARRELRITLRRAGRAGEGAADRATYVPLALTHRKRRYLDFDFDAAHVANDDDRLHITNIHDDVLNVIDVMPSLTFWYERIRTEDLGDGEHTDDESLVDSTTAPNVVAGYALCFSNMPEILNADFFRYLIDKYGATLLMRVYVVFGGQTTDSVFVVHVRSACVSTTARASVLTEPIVPRGIKTLSSAKKART